MNLAGIRSQIHISCARRDSGATAGFVFRGIAAKKQRQQPAVRQLFDESDPAAGKKITMVRNQLGGVFNVEASEDSNLCLNFCRRAAT